MIDFWLERHKVEGVDQPSARAGGERPRAKGRDAVVGLSSWSETLGHRAL